MHQAAVFQVLEFRRQRMAVRGQFWDRDARLKHVHVGLNMLHAKLHRINHIGAGRVIANPPSARDVDANAISANKVGIKGHNFVVLNNAWATFLEPRVRARTRGKQACFNPFAAAFDVLGVHHSPDVILADVPVRHIGAGVILHCKARSFAGVGRASHRKDLVFAFD